MSPTEPTYFFTETKRPDQYDSVGQIAEGYYRVTDGVLQLTDASGFSLGQKGRAKLGEKDDPLTIARRLLRGITTAQQNSFNRSLPSIPRGPV